MTILAFFVGLFFGALGVSALMIRNMDRMERPQ